jgi:hypothetical protein
MTFNTEMHNKVLKALHVSAICMCEGSAALTAIHSVLISWSSTTKCTTLTYKMIHAMAGNSAAQGLFQFLDHVGKIQRSISNQCLSAQRNSAAQWC